MQQGNRADIEWWFASQRVNDVMPLYIVFIHIKPAIISRGEYADRFWSWYFSNYFLTFIISRERVFYRDTPVFTLLLTPGKDISTGIDNVIIDLILLNQLANLFNGKTFGDSAEVQL